MVFGQPMDIGSQQRLGRDALFVGRFRKVVRDDSPVRVASPGGGASCGQADRGHR